MKRKITIQKKVFFIFIFLFFVFLLGEIGIRFLGLSPKLLNQPFFSPHSDLPYIYTPGYRFIGLNRTGEFQLDARVNDLGFLDENWPVEKPRSEKRIVFIGDSFTAGIARANAIEYTHEVERQLKKKVTSSVVNVLNMGIGGFSPEPERIVLEKYGLPHNPDAVVVNFVANDVLDTSRGLAAIRLGASGRLRHRHEAALGSWAPLYIRSHLARWALKIIILDQLPFNKNPDDFDEIYKIEGRYKEAWEKCFFEYRQMENLCDKSDIPLFLVYLCQPKSWTDDYVEVEEYLKKFCEQENIIFISTRQEIKELAAKELIYFPVDGHYQDNGNRVAATKVAQVLYSTLFE